MAFFMAVLGVQTVVAQNDVSSILTEEKGYQKITQMPDDLENYYFVIVEHTKQLIISLEPGNRQGNKTWYYRTAVDPNDDLSKLWTIEHNDNVNDHEVGYAFRNVKESEFLMQTEWENGNGGYRFRTNDQRNPCEWTQLLFVYADGSWTFENGRWPMSSNAGNKGYIGTWDEGTDAIKDGAEVAGNKQGDNIGHYDLYQILKETFDAYYKETHVDEIKALWETTKSDASVLLNNENYKIVKGELRANLSEVINKTAATETYSAYENLINEINAAMNSFKVGYDSYFFLAQEIKSAESLLIDVESQKELLESATASFNDITEAYQSLYAEANAKVLVDYPQDVTSMVGELTTWGGDLVVNKSQHWDGTNESSYSEQRGDCWSANSWTAYAEKKVVLPAGKYVLRATGRACSMNVNLSMSVDGNSVRYWSRNDKGLGVTTDGEASYDVTKSYTNNNAGRGWEYKYIAFTLETAKEVTFRVDASCDAAYQWMSISNIQLLTQSVPVKVSVSDAGWATMMLPFAAEIPAGLKVYSCDAVDENEILTLNEVNTIEANVPYIVASKPKDYTFEGINIAKENSYTSGLLTGVYAETPAPVGSYVLQNQSAGVAFYKVADVQPTVKANRAYLTLKEAGVNVRAIYFPNGDVDGVESVDAADVLVDVYTMSGIRVRSNVKKSEALNGLKGVYILKAVK